MAGVPFVGLTGGLGAGKSEALRALGELGAATLSTDAVVHELLATDELRDIVVARLGAGGGARRRARPLADRRARVRRRRGARLARGRAVAARGAAGGRVEAGGRGARPAAARGRGGGAAAVRVRDGGGVRRARSPWSPTRTCAPSARAPAGHAAVEERDRAPALAGGKGAESGLHGPQRRYARRVERDTVPAYLRNSTAVP